MRFNRAWQGVHLGFVSGSTVWHWGLEAWVRVWDRRSCDLWGFHGLGLRL